MLFRSLGLAQPTVSNALGRLRRLTGDPLFVRTGRGMVPTPHAERLAVPLREALATLRAALRARSRFNPAVDRRHFTLFLTDLGEAFFLPRLLAGAGWLCNAVMLHFPHAIEGVLFS